LAGAVTLGNANNTLTNSGTIGTEGSGVSYIGGIDADIVTNSKSILGNVELSGGTNKLTNSGTIGGNVSCGNVNDTIINSGSISNGVILGHGTNTLTNSGVIGGTILGGDGADTITNSGTISLLFLGDGDDKYTGGNNSDNVLDSAGADAIMLGGGLDVYTATFGAGIDGIDTIGGDSGFEDFYNAAGASNAVVINLDIMAHGIEPGKTATGADIAGAQKDTISGFESASGGSGNDRLHGTSKANQLQGQGGNDELRGYAGNDRLEGGFGEDTLEGGAGKDTLWGGADGDWFVYTSIKDSGVTAATRDIIMDFAPDGFLGDLIDLSAIDANGSAAGDAAFNFIGTHALFSGTAGELRAYWTADGQVVEGDVNGDRKADFSIAISDPTRAITFSNLNGVDFIL
jgi:Ca2+-binding RTX toxin-like protein